MAAATKTRTLEITRSTGKIRLTIPATAKVTYGMLHPGTRGGGWSEGNVLRIYEGTKQTAVFQHVTEFRDLAYEFQVEVVEEKNDADSRIEDGQVIEAGQRRKRQVRFEEVK